MLHLLFVCCSELVFCSRICFLLWHCLHHNLHIVLQVICPACIGIPWHTEYAIWQILTSPSKSSSCLFLLLVLVISCRYGYVAFGVCLMQWTVLVMMWPVFIMWILYDLLLCLWCHPPPLYHIYRDYYLLFVLATIDPMGIMVKSIQVSVLSAYCCLYLRVA